MILLSEDGKGLVKIESWCDIEGRPGYVRRVNEKEIKLKQIIGKYRINPMQPCGITSCGTKHGKGYLVLCEGGIETNIGHKCGRRIFGVEFGTLENTFKRDTNAQRYRENISKCKNVLSEYEKQISVLKNGDKQGDRCFIEMRWHATRGFDEFISSRLVERAKRKDGVLREDIELSDREKEIAKEAGNTATHRTKQVAIINGIEAFISYKKLKKLLHVHLTDELKMFKNLDEISLDYEKLKTWNNWANRIDLRIREAESIIEECNRFLMPNNILLIRNYRNLL